MTEPEQGHYHPLTIVVRDLEAIFRELGFSIAEGPEMETEYYNFDALNVPKDHPARDMQDTFWIKGKENTVLRTHTSNVQIRYMESHQPPIRIIVPGRTFRSEATDARHESVFHQIEGLAIDTDITLANLKGTLEYVLGKFFDNPDTKVRLRSNFFPFVEPGVEADASCFRCKGEKGCPLCKGTGWIELMGAGMVHPKVLSNVGINPRKFQGFAFGAGLERFAMVKYGIPDARMFASGDLRVVNQF